MKQTLLFFIIPLTLLFATPVLAQTEGDWSGVLSVENIKLTLVFHISQEKCTFDSPDQNAKGLPATPIFLSGDSVNLSIPFIGASFQGKLSEGTLQGTFTQRGQAFPLILQRGEQKRQRPQTPQPPFPYTTESVNFYNPDDGAMLSGTLTLPQGFNTKTPVLIMITGSGPQNRDEEVFGHKPFFVIADHLARHGMATLRYDDRGTAYSTGNVKNATTETFLRDAQAGIRFLRERGYKKVGALGHSEGGTIALLLAARRQIDFAITLAACATSGVEMLLDQNRALFLTAGTNETTTQAYCDALKHVLSNETYESSPLLSDDMTNNLKAVSEQVKQSPWMRYFVSLNIAPELSKIRCPVLALNGEKDLQVIAEPNLDVLRQQLRRNKRSRCIAYPNLNHLFQTCTSGLPAEYGTIEETISPTVLQNIAAWLHTL